MRSSSPLCTAHVIAVLAAVCPAQTGDQTKTDDSGTAGLVVIFDPAAFPGRNSLLAEARLAVRARTPRPDLVAALAAGAEAGAAPLSTWVAARGGIVRSVLWCPHAAVVSLPAEHHDAQAAHPLAAHVHTDWLCEGALGVATNANNHRADQVNAVLGLRGTGAVLALLDSGVQLQFGGSGVHPAFLDGSGQSRVIAAYNLSTAPSASDDHGHGTMVGAVAVGRRWNPTHPLADDGFAPDAGLISYRVADSNLLAPVSQIAAGYQTLLGHIVAATHSVQVANCSMRGSPDPLAVDQQALDTLALVGDVLVVTAAGNDALVLPQPSSRSQATTNGLSVAALTPDTHVVTTFSTTGPLSGDGLRTFPDLAAVGDGLSLPALQSNAVTTGIGGTSFAAPMVAGTALIVRAARPDLDALDTKTLLLHTLADLSAANAGKGRNHFGLGMLRTDLAAEDALALTRNSRRDIDPGSVSQPRPQLRRGTFLAGGPATATFRAVLKAGTDYAFTLAWLRTDTSTVSWDDLDLTITDAGGRLLALSRTPRNPYERVLFRPMASGLYRIDVVAAGLFSAAVDFALLAGPNRGGGTQEGHYATFGTGCAGSGLDPASGSVLPGSAFGGARTQFPLASGRVTLQQAYAASAFPGPTVIKALAFRRAFDQSDSPGWQAHLEVRAGYTTLLPNQLAPNLPQNRSGTMTVCLPPTWIDLLPTDGIPATTEFDFVVPLLQPFTYSPQSGNLLLEVELLANSRNGQPAECWLDAYQGPSHGRAYTFFVGQTPLTTTDDKTTTISLLTSAASGGTPRLGFRSPPRAGAGTTLVLRHAAAGSLAVLLQGLSNAAWNTHPLPCDLGSVGAPGCTLLVAPDAVLGLITDPVGQAAVVLAVPANPALTGTAVFHQFLVLDPVANPLGLILSDAGSGLIGG